MGSRARTRIIRIRTLILTVIIPFVIIAITIVITGVITTVIAIAAMPVVKITITMQMKSKVR